ncbi:DUF6160 family protein [Acinetobacter sp. ANC 4648]|uniref:putative pilus system protein FilA n=1 Tax=Acinetobacter sp. ANC 4648 TaxID=1977875 RepID=UPI000A330D46|nr:DUF6160 family protein [Acinetobacter sp. ANC 4648]OTG79825.1 pilus assembly protein FilA [Acinetobacter sp. ANC 4648]
MKLFTKLALVSAVTISANAMAMQAMDDASLSATTGQDGISIGIGISKIEIDKVHVFDGDGLAAGYTDTVNLTGGNPTVYTKGHAGAITVNNIVLSANTSALLPSHNLADVTIDTDGGAGSPFLNIGAAVSGLNIHLGKVEVNDVASGNATTPYKVGAGTATILNSLDLTTGATSANIQLGNTPQGAMIKLAGSMTGGLTISNLSLHDASGAGGGDIVLGSIHLNDTNSVDLSTDAAIAVKPTGLVITAMTKPTDIYIQKIGLGSAANSIGDVAISGLKVFNGPTGATPGAMITISGH